MPVFAKRNHGVYDEVSVLREQYNKLQADYAALVTLVNELKADYNAHKHGISADGVTLTTTAADGVVNSEQIETV